MSKKLIIKIKKDGTIEAETKGIKGKSCEDYVKTDRRTYRFQGNRQGIYRGIL